MKKYLPIIGKDKSIKEAMKCIGKCSLGIAFIVDKKELAGVATDGDIRRAILKGLSIDDPVEKIMNKKPVVIYKDWPQEKIRRHLNRKKIVDTVSKESVLKIPVLNNNRWVEDVIYVAKQDAARIEIIDRRKEKELNGKAESINKVLVIGGAGYLGSMLVRKLLYKGYKVRVFDNLLYGDAGIKDLFADRNFEFLKGDIRNVSNTVEAIKGVDAVIHLAAIVGDPACAVNPQEAIEINCLAMYNIVEACKFFLVNRLVFASSCSVYGENLKEDEELIEDSPLKPVSLYARTKIRCERKILDALDENFHPTILRMATLYGYSSNMRFDLVVNLFTGKALFDKKMTIFGGEQWRPFIHLEDAAWAHIRCLEMPIEKVNGKIFNLVSENYRINDIGSIIKSVYPEVKLEVSNKVQDIRNYRVSADRISRSLRFKPQKKVIDGIIEIKKITETGIITDYKKPCYRINEKLKAKI